MSTRRLWLVLAFLLLLPGEVMAHRHRAGLFYVPSKLFHSDSTSWVGVSGALPIFECRDLSAIGAFSRYSGTEDGKDLTQLVYTAGLRYTYGRNEWNQTSLFGQFSVGGVDAIQKIDKDASKHRTHGIVALGVGVDYRLKGSPFYLRLQGDVVHFSGRIGGAISVGVGWRKDPRIKDECLKKLCEPGSKDPCLKELCEPCAKARK